MIEKLKWFGWFAAAGLTLFLLAQRSCSKPNLINPVNMHDTVIVRGDSQLYAVQDTFLMPYKIYLRDSIPEVDTSKILEDYFATRVYKDTVKARDVTAVIEDSISANKIEGRKILIENSRDMHLTTLQAKPTNKLFAGGFIGYSLKNGLPEAGISLALLTKKNILFDYGYDALNRTQTIGVSWKIHFSKGR